jgi:hypothetical protein
VVVVVVGLVGTVLLLVTGSSIHLKWAPDDTIPDGVVIAGQKPDDTISCYPVLSQPDAVSRSYGIPVSDDGLNDSVGSSDEWLIRVQQYCERLRSDRMGWALLVALPTVLLGCGVITRSMLDRRDPPVLKARDFSLPD